MYVARFTLACTLQAALIASMFDVEENQRQAELEVASLEAAIAASLAFEVCIGDACGVVQCLAGSMGADL